MKAKCPKCNSTLETMEYEVELTSQGIINVYIDSFCNTCLDHYSYTETYKLIRQENFAKY